MARKREEMSAKLLFTTGEAAQACNLSQQTIIRCFDSGRLGGFRVPGSRSRRIPRDSLIQFMQSHGMSLGELGAKDGASGPLRAVILITDDSALARAMERAAGGAGFALRVARHAFEAGLLAAEHKPEIVMVDGAMAGAGGICSQIDVETGERKPLVVGVVTSGGEGESGLREAGVGEIIRVRLAHEAMVEVLRGVGAARG